MAAQRWIGLLGKNRKSGVLKREGHSHDARETSVTVCDCTRHAFVLSSTLSAQLSSLLPSPSPSPSLPQTLSQLLLIVRSLLESLEHNCGTQVSCLNFAGCVLIWGASSRASMPLPPPPPDPTPTYTRPSHVLRPHHVFLLYVFMHGFFPLEDEDYQMPKRFALGLHRVMIREVAEVHFSCNPL